MVKASGGPMALDWIKVDHPLRRDRRIGRLARMLRVSKQHALGVMICLWIYIDEQTEDGVLRDHTREDLDDVMGIEGATQILLDHTDWLDEIEGGFSAPRWTTKNGDTAKRRAVDARRKQLSRNASAGCPNSSGELSDDFRGGTDQEQETKRIDSLSIGRAKGRKPGRPREVFDPGPLIDQTEKRLIFDREPDLARFIDQLTQVPEFDVEWRVGTVASWRKFMRVSGPAVLEQSLADCRKQIAEGKRRRNWGGTLRQNARDELKRRRETSDG